MLHHTKELNPNFDRPTGCIRAKFSEGRRTEDHLFSLSSMIETAAILAFMTLERARACLSIKVHNLKEGALKKHQEKLCDLCCLSRSGKERDPNIPQFCNHEIVMKTTIYCLYLYIKNWKIIFEESPVKLEVHAGSNKGS